MNFTKRLIIITIGVGITVTPKLFGWRLNAIINQSTIEARCHFVLGKEIVTTVSIPPRTEVKINLPCPKNDDKSPFETIQESSNYLMICLGDSQVLVSEGVLQYESDKVPGTWYEVLRERRTRILAYTRGFTSLRDNSDDDICDLVIYPEEKWCKKLKPSSRQYLDFLTRR